MNQLLEKRRDFVKSRGGSWEVSEFDGELNDINREIIAAYKAENPACHLGNVNLYEYNRHQVMTPCVGQMVYNFEYTFVIPEFDQELHTMIIEYNKLPYSSGLMKVIDAIFNRIENTGGVTFQWV